VSQNNMPTVSVIGLGKLGSPMVACFAENGYRVIGVDVTPDVVEKINQGKAPVFEPGLDEMLWENRERISATLDFEKAISESEATFIIVPTPSDEQGGFSLEIVEPAIESIGTALRNKPSWHLVDLVSTVLPGSMEKIRELLENCSGKRCMMDFGLCYNPEFIALGSVIRNFLNPDFILVGESDRRSGDYLEALYKRVCDNDPPIARMNWVNAELTKIAVNTFVTTKITYANMLSAICEKLAGSDVDVVTAALGLDTRIGSRYLKGALGYGGPCFPRDAVAFAYTARQLGISAELAETTDKMNREQICRMVGRVKEKLPEGGKVGVLGLSYKPDTNVIEESQGLMLASALLTEGLQVIVYDPAAMEPARKVLGPDVQYASSMEDCTSQADVLVVTTPWDEFKSLRPENLRRREKRVVLIDCWRVFSSHEFAGVAEYIALGVGPNEGGGK
jgi:UDPglucose 6-dehydrogenase